MIMIISHVCTCFHNLHTTMTRRFILYIDRKFMIRKMIIKITYRRNCFLPGLWHPQEGLQAFRKACLLDQMKIQTEKKRERNKEEEETSLRLLEFSIYIKFIARPRSTLERTSISFFTKYALTKPSTVL